MTQAALISNLAASQVPAIERERAQSVAAPHAVHRLTASLALFAAWALAPAAHAATLTVNTAVDAFDVGGTCSLREAIDSANKNQSLHGCIASGAYGNDTINVPAGDFVLTRVGSDNTNTLGDLDLLDSVILVGAGPGVTNIRGDTSAPNADRDRILQVVTNGISVELRNLTLRDGRTNNQAAGAGLRSEPGTTTTLTNVVVGLNSADGNAGGILNQGVMNLDGSAVTNNETRNAADGGGGIFNDGTMLIVDSRILDNSLSPGNLFGAGVYNKVQASLTITNSAIEGNTATSSQIGGGGAGIGNFGSLDMDQCTVAGNISTGVGGGLESSCAQSTVTRTLFYGNEARTGGGFALFCNTLGPQPALVVVDSVVEANTASSAGGVRFTGHGLISRSTIYDNEADGRDGGSANSGGISLQNLGEISDSTVIGNRARDDGGGVGIFTTAATVPATLASVTIAGNTANSDGFAGGTGGGVYVSSNSFVTMTNAVLAGNLENGIGDHDDCDGAITNASYLLLQQGSGCTVQASTGFVQNVAAGLLPAADNGGPLAGSSNARVAARRGLTRAPSNTSPLLDAGDPAGCRDSDGTSVLTVDQRGVSRVLDGPDANTTARCDIGAVESDVIFANGFE